MDREKLKIAIIDDNKTSIFYLKLLLKKINLNNIESFQNPIEFIEYFDDHNDFDIIFIDYKMPNLNGIEVLQKIKKIDKDILTVMITSSTEIEVRQTAIENGISDFLSKDIEFNEFQAKINILVNLRLFYYEIQSYKNDLEKILIYKDKQEEMAVRKQYKIIEDYVSNHCYGEWLADSYFIPHDIISGDSYTTLRINEHKFFVAIVDGMGKGISASLTSVSSIAFLTNYVCISLEKNNYNFNTILDNSFINIKRILLDDEALSFAMAEIDIKEEKIKYANFGLPPFYIKRDEEVIKIKPNNFPLLSSQDSFKIDEVNRFDALLIASDGLNESPMKDDEYPYVMRLKDTFKNSVILSEIIDDFKKNVEKADDDMTVFYLTKDKNKYESIFNKKLLINREEIENLVNNIEFELPQDKISMMNINKIVFMLNEILLNVLEHSLMKIGKDKELMIENNRKIDYYSKDRYVFIKISANKDFVILEVIDDGEGFEVNKVLRREWFNKYHGRGIKMLKSLSSGIYYNLKGNKVKIYLKE